MVHYEHSMPELSAILLEKTVLGAILSIALLVFIIMSFIFSYHWKRFGFPANFFRQTTRLYFIGGSILAVVSVLFYWRILTTF